MFREILRQRVCIVQREHTCRRGRATDTESACGERKQEIGTAMLCGTRGGGAAKRGAHNELS